MIQDHFNLAFHTIFMHTKNFRVDFDISSRLDYSCCFLNFLLNKNQGRQDYFSFSHFIHSYLRVIIQLQEKHLNRTTHVIRKQACVLNSQ